MYIEPKKEQQKQTKKPPKRLIFVCIQSKIVYIFSNLRYIKVNKTTVLPTGNIALFCESLSILHKTNQIIFKGRGPVNCKCNTIFIK